MIFLLQSRNTLQRRKKAREELHFETVDEDSIADVFDQPPFRENVEVEQSDLESVSEQSSVRAQGSPHESDLDGTSSAESSDEAETSAIISSDNSNNASENSDINDDDDDEGLQALFEGSDFTAAEALYEVLKLYIEERWTKTSLNKNIKLIKRLLPQPNEFPSSSKAAFKFLKDLTVKSYCEEEYYYCPDCLQSVEDNSGNCPLCGCSDISKFYIFPPQVQIQHMFEQRQLADIIDYHRDHQISKEGFICDIQDGEKYKEAKQHLNGPYDITLVWNTDGIAMSGSSNQEMWPILATMCEIPPRLRPSFMLVCGVYVGAKAPDMNVFLKPFVSCLEAAFVNGVSWVHPKSKVTNRSKVVAPFLVADAPAKAMVQNISRFNGKYGCNTCEQKAKQIELTAEEILENEAQLNPRKRIKRQRRYLFQEDVGSAVLRCGPQMDIQGAIAEERGKPYKGVKGYSVVSNIPFFDRSESVCAEYMHLLLLGVVKYFLLKFFFDNKGEWFIGKKINQVDQYIHNIRVPDFVKRLPRSVKDVKYWKASEFRNFLLFYSLPVFDGILPQKYLQHWILLVGAAHILLKETISDNDINCAEIMIRAFVRDVGALYGQVCYTYNLHTLLHVCVLVRRCGNLWATSTFPFETFNGFIGAQLHGTKHLCKELIINIKNAQGVATLGNIVQSSESFPRAPPLQAIEFLGKSHTAKELLSEEELTALADTGHESLRAYKRAKIMSTTYSSKLYDLDKKRSNSIVQFQLESSEPKYGEIICFLKLAENEGFCLLRSFQVKHEELFFHEESRYIIRNLVPIRPSENYIVVPAQNILNKLLKIGVYLGIVPNSLEINL